MFVYMDAGGHATLSMTCVFCRRTTFATSQSLASTTTEFCSRLLLHVLPARCSRASMTYARERRARGSWAGAAAPRRGSGIGIGSYLAPRRPSQRARGTVQYSLDPRPAPKTLPAGQRAPRAFSVHAYARIAISDHTRRMLRYLTPRARRGKSAQL